MLIVARLLSGLFVFVPRAVLCYVLATLPLSPARSAPSFRIVFCAQIEDRVKRLSRFLQPASNNSKHMQHNASLALVANVFAMHSHTQPYTDSTFGATSAAKRVHCLHRFDY